MRLDGGAAFTGLVVFLANAALLVLQLVANRLLAPFIGSSLETWTSVIGVILAGISFGNAAGGRLADRAATPRTLQRVLALGALATLATLALVVALDGSTILAALPLKARIALLTALTCFSPAFVLSLLTPLAIRLLLPDVRATGRVVGVIYALGTLGSLAGNFLTGFVLIAWLSTYTIVGGIAGLLGVLALVTPWAAPEAAGSPGGEGAAAPDARVVPPLGAREACAIAFVASFCSMTLEMAASRLLAPYLGWSLHVWTGLIGVVLCGVAVGNWAGGWIADRFSRADVLGFCLLVASLATLYVLAMYSVLTRAKWIGDYVLIARILIWSALLFLPVMIGLGTISPQVTRLAVADVDHAGRVAGWIYAWSCAGAIAGTFATGWWLIQWVGVLKVIFAVALALGALAVPAGRMWERAGELAAGAVLVLGGSALLWINGKLVSPFVRETNYFSIYYRVQKRGDDQIRLLVLDKLLHSMVRGREVVEDGRKVFRADPAFLGYWHERTQAELAVLASLAPDPRILVIGGGGYTMPRWIDRFLKEVRCEVVEIDPGVTEVAHEHLGLPRDVRFTAHHFDGRQFVQEHALPGSYQLVMQDAVNDLAVPFHLLTREYNDAIKRILKPGGVYLLTVIDDWATGRLYRAAITTLRRSFPHVHVICAGRAWERETRSPMVIYASREPLDLERERERLAQRGIGQMVTTLLPPADLVRLVDAMPHLVLTDTYAPVENLIPVYAGAEPAPVDPVTGYR